MLEGICDTRPTLIFTTMDGWGWGAGKGEKKNHEQKSPMWRML
jgi:hypothetical protein